MIDVITDHIDIWTSAQKKKSAVGRGSSSKFELYGIKKLRELILGLAVQGKLVPQDPNDVPASELLKKIEEEKERLLKDKKIKRSIKSPQITENEKPFNIPSTWEWARLTDLYYSISPSGKKLKSSEMNELGDFPVVDQGQSHIAGYTNDEDLLIEIPGPIIIFGDHTTAKKYIDFNFVAGADGTKILRPYKMDERFFYTYLLSYKLENRGYARHFKVLNDNIMALPPICEQQRIVKKVDELMALCDQLEEEIDNKAAHQTLVKILLNTLTSVKTAKEFTQNWQRISEHFDILFTTEESIEELKQTILQLAVIGKLIPQDANDEPASELLKKIEEEKEQLVKEKKIKKPIKLAVISENDKPYTLPCSWEFTRLGNITNRIGSGSTPRGGKSAYYNEGIAFLRSQNIRNDGLKLEDVAFINDKTHEKMNNTKVFPDDILLNITGGSLGRSTIFPENIGEANVSQHVSIIRPTIKATNQYLHYCILSPYIQGLIWGRQVGMAREGLSKKVLELFEIPFPPLKEQIRIVAKVDDLMDLCDTLKTTLNEAQETQVLLADAIVEKAM